ncbi:MAG: hypothetical protein IJ604_02735 [Prevotella sp.]|nr:hypothetical protein [Prevotella sp.]
MMKTRNILALLSVLFLTIGISGCSGDEDGMASNSIVGKWVLKEIRIGFPGYSFTDGKDIYEFKEDNTIIVKRKDSNEVLFLDNGIYNYDYNKEKNVVIIDQKEFFCFFLSEKKLHIGISSIDDNGTVSYFFDKID